MEDGKNNQPQRKMDTPEEREAAARRKQEKLEKKRLAKEKNQQKNAPNANANANANAKANANQAVQQEKQMKTEEDPAETLDANQYRELRIAAVESLKRQGVDPYPHKFQRSIDLKEYVEKYNHLKDEEVLKETTERVVGRIMFRRDLSNKLIFLKINQDGHHLQVLVNYAFYEDKEKWDVIIQFLRIGDIIAAVGHPSRSKKKELSIIPVEIVILSPCLHMIPRKILDIESRYRSRHLDMLVHPNVVATFQTRSKIITYVRNFFNLRGYLEVETPTMSILAGGATAKPFITHHNDLDIDLFMRVAPELYLKQLVIGGMHKVYEIGKNYRNEGIDATHNPEFTAIESYEAFADYNDLIVMTEELLSGLVFSLFGKYKVNYHPNGREDQLVYELDFTPPFKRYPLIASLEKTLSELEGNPIVFPTDFTSADTNKFLLDLCKKHECEGPLPHTNYRLLDALCGKFIEKQIVSPGFITDHPQIMSPLAKYHRNSPGLTERFELFVAKKEIVNAYTELNEPSVQRALFQAQAQQNKGDDEAQPVDEGYCTAMEYGLPPTGGWGMGIDRLCMMLTDNNNIKEVILFPAMKPLGEQLEAQVAALASQRKQEKK
jgi:lysyl-tRNA synthetase class 2